MTSFQLTPATRMQTAELNYEYLAEFLRGEESDALFEELHSLPFYRPTFNIGQKLCSPNRLVFGFGAGVSYTFSGHTVQGHPWIPSLLSLKKSVESATGATYNFALLNLYEDGKSSIAAHKDDEKSQDLSAPIPTISLGATRVLEFSRDGFPKKTLPLEHGSLYIMHPPTNQYFKHGIPKDEKVHTPRISISFRQILLQGEPSAKKRKLSDDDELPHNDWFAKHLLGLNSLPPVYWKLQRNLYAYVSLHLNKIRVHIREMIEKPDESLVPTQNGVAMTPATWIGFRKQVLLERLFLSNFREGFINHQLAVFRVHNDEIVQLQQMYKNGDSFNLKMNCVKVQEDQMSTLEEHQVSITNCIMQFFIEEVLPFSIRKAKSDCLQSEHESTEQTKARLMETLHREVYNYATSHFQCDGCMQNRLSDFYRHDCMTMSETDKYLFSGGLNNVLMIDYLKLAKLICEKNCTCSLEKSEVYDIFKVETLKAYLEKPLLKKCE